MTQPDRAENSNRPMSEIIHPDIRNQATSLVMKVEANERLLNPNSARRLTWRQSIVGGRETIVEGVWRGSNTAEPIFRVLGKHGFGSDQTTVDFPNPTDPVVVKTINDILAESARKRVVKDLP